MVAEFRPMAHTAKLKYMDLVAVKECTDARFLPEQYRSLTQDEVDDLIDGLKIRL